MKELVVATSPSDCDMLRTLQSSWSSGDICRSQQCEISNGSRNQFMIMESCSCLNEQCEDAQTRD